VLLGIAISVKYYPAVFLVCFALRRDARVLLAAGVTAAVGLVVLPLIILGPVDSWVFYQGTFSMVKPGGFVARDPNSQYLLHVAQRLWALPPTSTAGSMLPIVGYACFAFGLFLVARVTRSNIDNRSHWAFCAIFLSLPLVVRTSWPHYFVYLPFCQAFLASVLLSRRRGTGIAKIALFVLPSVVLSSIVFFNRFPRWTFYSSGGYLFFSNALLLLLVYWELIRRLWPRGAGALPDEQTQASD
jgi:hypothetical protein